MVHNPNVGTQPVNININVNVADNQEVGPPRAEINGVNFQAGDGAAPVSPLQQVVRSVQNFFSRVGTAISNFLSRFLPNNDQDREVPRPVREHFDALDIDALDIDDFTDGGFDGGESVASIVESLPRIPAHLRAQPRPTGADIENLDLSALDAPGTENAAPEQNQGREIRPEDRYGLDLRGKDDQTAPKTDRTEVTLDDVLNPEPFDPYQDTLDTLDEMLHGPSENADGTEDETVSLSDFEKPVPEYVPSDEALAELDEIMDGPPQQAENTDATHPRGPATEWDIDKEI